MTLKSTVITFLATAQIVLFGSICHAEIELSDKLFLSGHGTLGVLYDDDKDAQYFRDLSQSGSDFDQLNYESDTRAGLRLSYNPRGLISAQVQTLTRYGAGQYETNLFSAEMQLNPGSGWLFRAGLVPSEAFYHSDSSHVGYSYLWARPPEEFYHLSITGNLIGLNISKLLNVGLSTVKLKLYGGEMVKQISTHSDSQFNIKNSAILGAAVDFQSNTVNLAVGMALIDLDEGALLDVNTAKILFPDSESTANIIDEAFLRLVIDGISDDYRLNYFFTGGSYWAGAWRFEAGLSALDSGIYMLTDTYTGFLSVGYKRDRWTPFVIYSYGHNNTPNHIDTELPDFIDNIIADNLKGSRIDQYNLGLGARFELSHYAALKFQYNYVKSAEKRSFRWENEDPNWDGDANLFSVVLDVLF